MSLDFLGGSSKAVYNGKLESYIILHRQIRVVDKQRGASISGNLIIEANIDQLSSFQRHFKSA